MSAIEPVYVKSGEYEFAREVKAGSPFTALVAEHLGPDIIVTICNAKTNTVVLARQIDPKLLPEIVEQLLDSHPADKEPQTLMVSFVGGEDSSARGEQEQESQPGYQYFLQALSALEECARPGAKHIASKDPYLPEVKIEGPRVVFRIIGSDIFNKPHPNSVYLTAKTLQPREFTAGIKGAMLFSPTPPTERERDRLSLYPRGTSTQE